MVVHIDCLPAFDPGHAGTLTPLTPAQINRFSGGLNVSLMNTVFLKKADSEEQTVSEEACIKEEQLEVDIKIEHAGDGKEFYRSAALSWLG